MDELMADDIIKDAKAEFARCEEAWADNRREFLDDIRFARLAEQWPEGVKKQRDAEHRPCLTINRLPSFIRQVVNDSRQNKPAIKVRPADDKADMKTAEIINGLVRNIEYTSNADTAYDTAVDNAVTGGFGFFRINTQYAHDDAFDLDLAIDRVNNPLTIYGDPDSTAADSSDWNIAFVTELIHKNAFGRRYKGADEKSWEGDYDALEDSDWRDGEYIRIAERWERKEVKRTILKLSNGLIVPEEHFLKARADFDAAGIQVVGDRPATGYEVKQQILTGCEVLESNDWAGRYIPIVPVYGDEVTVEGTRYFRSLIRDAKDPQRMFNFWRTAATELVALAPKAPWIGPKGFAKSDPRWQTANTVSHPYLEYEGQIAPDRQPFAGMPAGALQEAMNAADDLKSIMGLYDASMGARSNETSGRAILARQREGDVSTFHFLDNLSRAIRHAGRILIDLIPHVYSGPRIVRVLGLDGTPKTVPVNQQFEQRGEMLMHDLTTGKYDLTVEAGPSYTTKRQEASESLNALVTAYPPLMQVAGDLLVKNMDFLGADDVANRLKATLPPAIAAVANDESEIPPEAVAQIQQGQQQMQMMGQQMQAMGQELQKAQGALNAKTLDVQAKQADAQAQQSSNALELETRRLEYQRKGEELEVKREEIQLKREQIAMERADMMGQMQAMHQTVQDGIGKQTEAVGQTLAQVMQAMQEMHGSMQSMHGTVKRMSGRKTPVRGPDGRTIGLAGEDGRLMHRVERDAQGRVAGLAPVEDDEPPIH